MKILIAASLLFALCGCASDARSRRLIEVGQSCAALGKLIQVSDTPQPYIWDAMREPDTQVRCR